MSGAIAAAVNAAFMRLVTLQDPGLAASYTDYKSGIVNQTNTITLVVKADGTWTVNGNGSLLAPASGNWGTPTSPGAGANYEAQVVDNTGAGGGGVLSNPMASFIDLSVDRTLTFSISDTTLDDGSRTASRSFTLTVRKIGTTSPTFPDTFTLNPQAEKTSV